LLKNTNNVAHKGVTEVHKFYLIKQHYCKSTRYLIPEWATKYEENCWVEMGSELSLETHFVDEFSSFS
jgi:hypothetical protein